MKKNKLSLIVGDILALVLVTMIGFVTHGEGGIEYLPRMVAAFFPLTMTWLILAPWFDLFNLEVPFNLKRLGQLALAILFAAPLALVFRGLLLKAPIIPIFAVVFTLTSMFGLIVWRVIYVLFTKK